MSVMVRLVDFQMTVTQLGFTALLETPLYGGKEKHKKNTKEEFRDLVSLLEGLDGFARIVVVCVMH